MIKNLIHKIIMTKSPKPRILKRCGGGGLHDEQQYCFELGFREGIKKFRKAQKDKYNELQDRNTKARKDG